MSSKSNSHNVHWRFGRLSSQYTSIRSTKVKTFEERDVERRLSGIYASTNCSETPIKSINSIGTSASSSDSSACTTNAFKLSSFDPAGDQHECIETLVSRIEKGCKYQVLRGATGTGKTFGETGEIAIFISQNISSMCMSESLISEKH